MIKNLCLKKWWKLCNLRKEKGIKQEIIVDAIKAALVAAYKKNYNQAQNVEVVFDEKKGQFQG